MSIDTDCPGDPASCRGTARDLAALARHLDRASGFVRGHAGLTGTTFAGVGGIAFRETCSGVGESGATLRSRATAVGDAFDDYAEGLAQVQAAMARARTVAAPHRLLRGTVVHEPDDDAAARWAAYGEATTVARAAWARLARVESRLLDVLTAQTDVVRPLPPGDGLPGVPSPVLPRGSVPDSPRVPPGSWPSWPPVPPVPVPVRPRGARVPASPTAPTAPADSSPASRPSPTSSRDRVTLGGPRPHEEGVREEPKARHRVAEAPLEVVDTELHPVEQVLGQPIDPDLLEVGQLSPGLLTAVEVGR